MAMNKTFKADKLSEMTYASFTQPLNTLYQISSNNNNSSSPSSTDINNRTCILAYISMTKENYNFQCKKTHLPIYRVTEK